jgi:hypothetical protein
MGSEVAGAGVNPADQRWGFWPLLPLYPYGHRRTLVRELIPEQLWSFEQLQGVFYVAVRRCVRRFAISSSAMARC